MNATERKRPLSVTVIGWIFIGLAAMGMLSGLMTLTFFASMKQIEGFEFPPSREEMLGPMAGEMPPALLATYGVIFVLFRYFYGFITLQMLFSVFVLIAGIQFLRLQAWARAALEVITWLGLVYHLSFLAFWLAAWIGIGSVASNVPMAEGGPPPFFLLFGVFAAVAVGLFWAVPHIVVIKFLRGGTIRRATSQG